MVYCFIRGTFIGSGSTFNPVGVAGSGLTDTNTPGTYTFYAECSTQPGCRTATNFIILPLPAKPAITAGGSTSICTPTGSVSLQSSSATSYQWSRNNTPIGGATLQTYNATQAGDYTVAVSDGTCTSLPSDPVTVTSITPSITTAPQAVGVCMDLLNPQVTTLDYSSTLNNPSTYSITWNSIPANSFAPVTNALLPVSPISITVPAGTAVGTYTGNISVRNAFSCESSPIPFTLIVNTTLTADFNYVSTLHNLNGDPQYCQSNPNNPAPVINAPAGNESFSANSTNLVFANASTGEIDLGALCSGSLYNNKYCL